MANTKATEDDNRVQIRLSPVMLESMRLLSRESGQPLGTVCADAIESFVMGDDFDRVLDKLRARKQLASQGENATGT